MKRHHGSTFVAISVAALTLGLCGCCKSGSEACPSRYRELTADKQVGEAKCTCADGSATGSVWGSDIYTSDSSICAAAVHAGVITTSGGEVKVKNAAGCPAYVGTERNGITTGKWGPYQTSFYFPDKGDGQCAAAPAAPTAPAGNVCPTRFKDIPALSASTTITCTCNASATSAGPLWGTDIYTQDSVICKAAAHAGAIPLSGGMVTAKAASGCKSYEGTTRNGVTSSKWGSYDASFYFPAKGTGACL